MAIRHIIAQGLGFTPGTTHWLVTHGFGSGVAPVVIVVGQLLALQRPQSLILMRRPRA